MVNLHAHGGIYNQHTRGIKLRNVIGTHEDVVISDNQSTKHRVTLFNNMVITRFSETVGMEYHRAIRQQI